MSDNKPAAQQEAPIQAQPSITLDFKQATELLAIFGGEPSEVTLTYGDGHSGKGIYAYYTEYPGEGAEYIGVSDCEALPTAAQPVEAAPVSQEPARVALIKARTALETCVQDELEGGGGAQYFEDDAVDAAIREIDAFLAAQAAPVVVDAPEVTEMVNRFLGWPLPKTFGPDCGISFKPLAHPNAWPIGTNLFTADEARAMFEYVLAATHTKPATPEGQA
jgi:hypothetical protein